MAPALPEMQAALLVEDFGPGALGANPDFFELIRIRKVLMVRDIFRIAGTEHQKQLSQAQWEMVRDLNRMAAEEAQGDAE
ncbi:MAG: hypothetical protein ABIG44_00845 [Planctomycetota bacterium]